MVKQATGIWEATVGPLPPGAYRYVYLSTAVVGHGPQEPVRQRILRELLEPDGGAGAAFMELRKVPHGSVAEVTYFSASLNRFPPDARVHSSRLRIGPGNVSCILPPPRSIRHGRAWTTVGRAGIILDNLITDKKAVPMIVVMRRVTTGPFIWRP